jgi:hypothetical protein
MIAALNQALTSLLWTVQVRKHPPDFSEGQILCTLHHKDLKSLVNQAVDALK